MNLAENLRASLQGILVSGSVEIRENGSRVISASPLSWEVRGNAQKPLLHLWSENCNVTRRVVAITDNSQDRLALAVERFGRVKPERMEIVRLEYAPSPRDLSREGYCEQSRRILAEQFPDETLEKISVAQDLEHSLSKIYTRGILRRGSSHVAFLAVGEGESQDALENSLTYGLLWLEKSRQSAKRAALATLRLILPKGKSAILAKSAPRPRRAPRRRSLRTRSAAGNTRTHGSLRNRQRSLLARAASRNATPSRPCVLSPPSVPNPFAPTPLRTPRKSSCDFVA